MYHVMSCVLLYYMFKKIIYINKSYVVHTLLYDSYVVHVKYKKKYVGRGTVHVHIYTTYMYTYMYLQGINYFVYSSTVCGTVHVHVKLHVHDM